GQQFDPEVVRAFLALSLGRLRVVAGPASLLSGIPGLESMPLTSLAPMAAGASTAVTTSAAVVVAGVVGTALTVTGTGTGTGPGSGAGVNLAGPAPSSLPADLDAAGDLPDAEPAP